MILAQMNKEDVKLGIKIYAPAMEMFGVIVCLYEDKQIRVRWEDGAITYMCPYTSFKNSEVIDNLYFIISQRKK